LTGEEYLAAVEAHLNDLPWRARKNLATDLRVHLEEIPGGEDLEARLGSPGNYAAELRAAAGLRSARGPVAFLRARRPRNVAIAVGLLVAVGVVVVAVVWASSYQPLVTGSTSLSPIPSQEGALGETVAPYRNGKLFQYGFSIRNDGRFSVRILAAPLDQRFLPFRFRVFAEPSGSRGVSAHPQPFRPFTLSPGSEWLIVLRGRYANCHNYVASTSSGFDAMPVRARFLLWTRTVFVPLGAPLIINRPNRDPCS
jgi:hypothetical protein